MTPQDKLALVKFTAVVKKIVYDPERMKTFLTMLGTRVGALHAVHAVLAVIEKHKPIPTAIVHQLGVNAYMAMVHTASLITGHKPDQEIVHSVISAIQHSINLSHGQVSTAIIPKGIIGSQMGVSQ